MTALECQRFLPLVVDLAEGTIPAADRGRVEAHVAACPECRDALDAVRQAPGLVGTADTAPMPGDAFFAAQRRDVMRTVGLIDDALARERQRGRWRTGWTALAAGIVAVVAARTLVVSPVEPTGPDPALLARLELLQAFADGDPLLGYDMMNASGTLDADDIQALDDLLGTA